MYNLLLVDDEPYIVDYLGELMRSQTELELDIFSAYTSAEALQWLGRVKIDIVLTDIQMPGMSGLALQQEIVGRWPNCKVIFLTGYTDMKYMQTAIRNGSVDYVLKTEGEETILAAVRKAAEALDLQLRDESLLARARQQLVQALPALRKRWIGQLMEENEFSPETIGRQLTELDIPLCPQCPTLVMLGRVDRWQRVQMVADRLLLLYAVQNIAVEWMSAGAVLVPVEMEDMEFAWFIQPKEAGDRPQEESDWERVIRFAHGTVEDIQRSCRELLGVSISVVMGDVPVPWTQAGRSLHRYKWQLVQGYGQDEAVLLGHRKSGRDEERAREGSLPGKTKWSLLETYLDSGQKEEFMALLDELFRAGFAPGQSLKHIRHLQLFYALTAFALSYMNSRGGMEEIAGDVRLNELTDFESHVTCERAAAFFSDLFARLFHTRMSEQEERTHNVVRTVNQYVNAHLHDDLSLVRLAEIAYLSPTYLSKLYKQSTGVGLSDYITEARLARAVELLKDNRYKIHEIAAMVGMGSAPYFTRFFKRKMNMSPQEYRETAARPD